jgi:hypothetical protein
VLNSSSPLNQVNDQHDDRNDEQEMDQTTANVTKQTKEPEHEQDNDYSPKHGWCLSVELDFIPCFIRGRLFAKFFFRKFIQR